MKDKYIEFDYVKAMIVLAGLICLRQRFEAGSMTGKLFWRVEHLRQIFSSYESTSENPQLRNFRLCFGDALIFDVARKIVYGNDVVGDYERLLRLEPRLRMSDDA